MLKIEQVPTPHVLNQSIEHVFHVVVKAKIERILVEGLPSDWIDTITAPFLSDSELKVEHDRLRTQCGNDLLEPSHPRYCKTAQACESCTMFDPGSYSIGWMLAEHGDILLYPTKQNRTKFDRLFDRMTDAIAVLAFVPGGVPGFWGYSYEATIDES